jgi:molybdopterin synthase sulfur carrier subunit
MAPRRISVLFFGGSRDAAGTSEEAVELGDGITTIGDLAAYLERIHPALAGRLDGVRFAINEAFVDGVAEVRAGDVVAVIPPVSGG